MNGGVKSNQKMQWMQQQVFKRLTMISVGCLVWQDGQEYCFGQKRFSEGSDDALRAVVTVHSKNFYKKFVWGGSIGAAESYINGDWSCDNLTKLIEIFIANEQVLTQVDRGWSVFSNTIGLIKNLVLRNHIRRSRANILAHYDLSNEFFGLFLDKNRQYSCAVFDDPSLDLDTAQLAKLRQICDGLKLRSTDHLLEIGSGWGGLAIFAAQNYGCRVTTTTISDAQYAYTKQKIDALGLTQRITVLKKDYRLLTGQYDKLVSIEMIEAVGHQYFDRFFQICDRLLKTGGLYFLQAITIHDFEYARYKREVDFIKAYVFPGGCLPCIAALAKSIEKQTRLCIRQITDIGQDYALTLGHWTRRLAANREAVKQLGFDDKVLRLFEFYFAYCRAGFLSGRISDVQIILEKL